MHDAAIATNPTLGLWSCLNRTMLLRPLLLLPVLLRQCIAYTTLSDDSIRNLPAAGSDFDINNGALLAPILIPRVPGTPGQLAVLQHFVDFFGQNLPKWTLSYQNSTSETPTSQGQELPFYNLVATRDPPWASVGEVGRLALVAHYDSKITPEGFIGATDSAAPCAMLLHAARSLDKALTKKWAAMEAEGLGAGGYDGLEEHKGIQIILLDGEEAFDVWTHTDSIYGARSLAEEWERTMHPSQSTYQTPLGAIDLFVLLDLLGAKNPSVPSYFKTTHWAYQAMADVESRIRGVQRFKSSPNHPSKRHIHEIDPDKDADKPGSGKPRREPAFLSEASKKDTDRWYGGFVEDDHVPFMARGVEILHLIPAPFPHVWHTMDDDGEHLDLDTVEDWATLTTAFAAEWLDLDGFFDGEAGAAPDTVDKRQYRETGKTEL